MKTNRQADRRHCSSEQARSVSRLRNRNSRSEVSRYQAMPAPQGQTFYVVPDGGAP